MTGQRHNPRECWCGIDHSRYAGSQAESIAFATIIAPFDECANCGSKASENVSWNRTGGWTCAACGESDYPEAAE